MTFTFSIIPPCLDIKTPIIESFIKVLFNMKLLAALILAAGTGNFFVAATCKWHQCWEITHDGAATGWKGSEKCEDKCPSGRWRDRTFAFPDSWGCRLDVDDDVDTAVAFSSCCFAQGAGYNFFEEEKNRHLIRWSQKGDSFIVPDEDEFANSLRLECFEHKNYASLANERKKKTPGEKSNLYFRCDHTPRSNRSLFGYRPHFHSRHNREASQVTELIGSLNANKYSSLK
ncbi:hypothetical protein BGZ63DRAFT_424452 [Mariannaea sp. PMI_226]|nr:hypothetical protein BGZ63DRAFT_424452 [Mariannaea sp. PMI_226]